MRVNGRNVPAHLRGELVSHSGPRTTAAMARTFFEHGYVLLRSALPHAKVDAAQAEVFARLHAVGEVESPRSRIWTGHSDRGACHPDLGAFWQSVCEGARVRALSHGDELRGLVSALIGEDSRPTDILYMRPTVAGTGTALHADFTFFATDVRDRRMINAWVPCCEIPIDEGPLLVVEGTHAIPSLVEPLLGIDFVSRHSGGSTDDANRMTDVVYQANPQVLDLHPIELAERYGVRLLTTEFKAGDVVLLSMLMLHGACDNLSPSTRLSVDVRYQPASHPADDKRFFGPNPSNLTGGGYADMSGAQPLGPGGHAGSDVLERMLDQDTHYGDAQWRSTRPKGQAPKL
jgi:hypothetical protein